MLCIFSSISYAQGEIDEEKKVLFRDEFTVFIGVNTNGLASGARYGVHKDRLHKSFYEVQFFTLHHPKEIKLASPTGRMVYGKMNDAFSLVLTMGNQKELYSKLDKGSVAISRLFDYGFALSFEKPVYYYIVYPDVVERFNTSNHAKYGKAPFSRGLDETKLIPGVFAKTCLQFEYSKEDKEIRALEIGLNVHAYMRKIQIMFSDDNSWFYPSIYINYRFGGLLKP